MGVGWGWGGVVGEVGNKAISAFNSVEVEVEAELGKIQKVKVRSCDLGGNVENREDQ